MFKPKFGMMPGHWGLTGKTREIAKAEYELTGYELEEKLLSLKEDELDPKDFYKKSLDVKLKHKKLTEEEYYRALAEKIEDEGKRNLALLELDYKAGKVDKFDYEKKAATLRGEPWVIVLNMDFSKGSSLEGSFELDWNEFFVEKLKAEGYTGPTPDNIVNQWFMELCKNIALEEFDGTGNFTPDAEANLESYKRWSSETLPTGKKGYS